MDFKELNTHKWINMKLKKKLILLSNKKANKPRN